MDTVGLIIACAIYLAAGVLGVSVGGTSIITVPALIMLGMSPQSALATNMFTLIFLCATGFFFFGKKVDVPHRGLIIFFSLLTLVGSLIGAFFVVAVDQAVLKKTIAFTIMAMSVPVFFASGAGEGAARSYKITLLRVISGALLVFALGIYGGFFSGGYMLMLGYVLVLVFDYNFLEAAFLTKIFNFFSSAVACAVFAAYGLIDYRLGLLLAVFISIGAWIGVDIALRKGSKWLKNVFILTTLALAIKLLFF